MRLFNLKDGKVIIEPEALTIPEFEKIWEYDRAASKSRARAELSIVYHMCDFNSPYFNYSEGQRYELLKKDFITQDEKYVLTKRLKDAFAKYRELNQTPSELSIIELRETLDSMRSIVGVFRKNIEAKLKDKKTDFDEVIQTNRNGTVVTKLALINSNLMELLKTAAAIPKIIEQLAELEKKVKTEKAADKSRVRGNKKISYLESKR